jgi:hypothetical protein
MSRERLSLSFSIIFQTNQPTNEGKEGKIIVFHLFLVSNNRPGFLTLRRITPKNSTI